MGRIEDLLLLEGAGQLPSDMQKDLDTLRTAGLVPGGKQSPSGVTQPEQPRRINTARNIVDASPRSGPEGFFETLGTELTRGHKQMSDASVQGQAGQPPVYAPGLHQTGGLNQMLLAPVTAGFRAAGQGAQDTSMAVGEKLGVPGPTNANIGAAIGAGVDIAGNIAAVPQLLSGLSPKLRSAFQAALRHAPGAQIQLREMGKADISHVMATLKNQGAKADDLYKVVETLNPSVATPEYNRIARTIFKGEEQLKDFGLELPGVAKAASGAIRGTTERANPAAKWLGDEFGQDPRTQLKETPFSLIADVRKRLGAKIGELRQKGGEELGDFKQLYGALSRDLENSANTGVGKAFSALKHANETAKREFAVAELDDIFNQSMGRALEGQEFTSSNFAKALNKVRDERRENPLFESGLGKKTLDEIEKRLNEYRQLKITPPPKGVNVGSALVGTRMGIGGSVGFALGGPVGAAIGTFAGAAVPPAISTIIRSEAGSKALMETLKRQGAVPPEHFQAIIALSLANPDGKRDVKSEVTEMLKEKEIPIQEKIGAILKGQATLTEIKNAQDLIFAR